MQCVCRVIEQARSWKVRCRFFCRLYMHEWLGHGSHDRASQVCQREQFLLGLTSSYHKLIYIFICPLVCLHIVEEIQKHLCSPKQSPWSSFANKAKSCQSSSLWHTTSGFLLWGYGFTNSTRREHVNIHKIYVWMVRVRAWGDVHACVTERTHVGSFLEARTSSQTLCSLGNCGHKQKEIFVYLQLALALKETKSSIKTSLHSNIASSLFKSFTYTQYISREKKIEKHTSEKRETPTTPQRASRYSEKFWWDDSVSRTKMNLCGVDNIIFEKKNDIVNRLEFKNHSWNLSITLIHVDERRLPLARRLFKQILK